MSRFYFCFFLLIFIFKVLGFPLEKGGGGQALQKIRFLLKMHRESNQQIFPFYEWNSIHFPFIQTPSISCQCDEKTLLKEHCSLSVEFESEILMSGSNFSELKYFSNNDHSPFI